MSLRTHIILVTGVAFSVIVIFLPTFGLFGRSSSVESAFLVSGVQTLQKTTGLPIRLVIPEIGVDAAIESVGLTTSGAMDAPKDPADTGWFNLGPRPGESGSAIIDGHFGWKNNTPAVFDKLSTLQSGDKIYVEDEKGVMTTFVVRKLQIYGENANASDVFSSSDGKSHLNLITCGGSLDATSKSYSDRLVVFADNDTEPL